MLKKREVRSRADFILMGKSIKRLVLAGLIIVLTGPLQAKLTSQYTGIKGASFLQIGTSPAVESMGSSYVSIGEKDINSLNYNPAGLCDIKNYQFMFSTLDWIDNVALNHLAFAMPNKKLEGTVFSSLTFLTLPDVVHYNDWGESIGTMDFFNMSFTAGYARNFSGYQTGINCKFLYEKVADDTLTGAAVDVGTIYQFKPFSINVLDKYLLVLRKFSVGLAVRNIGTKIGSDGLPLSIDMGYSFLLAKGLQYSFTVIKPVYNSESLGDSDYKLNFGLAWNFEKIFFLRTGLKLNYDIPNNYTVGFGVRTKFRNGVVIVDYAYAAYTYLEKTHRIGLTFRLRDLIFW